MARFESTPRGAEDGSVVRCTTRANNQTFKDCSRTWRYLEAFMKSENLKTETLDAASIYNFVIMLLRISKRYL